MPRTASFRRLHAIAATLAVLLSAGCTARTAAPHAALVWVVAQPPPSFDPGAPADPVAWAFMRLLGRGLTTVDSTGRAAPDAAERVDVAPDGRTVTFHFAAIAFADGSPCTSDDFARALRSALERRDHATARWLLRAVTGVPAIRSGRPLPKLGIECPDPGTLTLHLSRPDPALLEKLAVPGLAMPWKAGAADGWSAGIGHWRRLSGGVSQWTLVRAGARARAGAPERPTTAAVETLHVRFAMGAARVHALLRSGEPDLVWPLPPGLLGLPLDPAYGLATRDARPERSLLLVLRADLPPTSKPAARHALALAVDRPAVLAALGRRGRAGAAYENLPDLVAHDPAQVRGWLERGNLGRSLHVVLGYAADREGAEVARVLQSEWALQSLDAELEPARGERLARARIDAVGPHATLVEHQALLPGLGAWLVDLVMPIRDAQVGPVRTGWRTREFDSWIGPSGSGDPDPALVGRRLGEEDIVLPLARLPWAWIERNGGVSIPVHPRYGPDPGSATLALDSQR